MKIADIIEEITNHIEEKMLGEWKHEGYIDGCTSDEACVVIDGKKYEIKVREIKVRRS